MGPRQLCCAGSDRAQGQRQEAEACDVFNKMVQQTQPEDSFGTDGNALSELTMQPLEVLVTRSCLHSVLTGPSTLCC